MFQVTPVVCKTRETEPALARAVDCLCLVYHHFGLNLGSEQVRSELEKSPCLEAGLVKAARARGFDAHRIRARRTARLRNMPTPYIVGWKDTSFIVVEQEDPFGYTILDPMVGRRYVDGEQFLENYGGHAICLAPRALARVPSTFWHRLRTWVPWLAVR